VATFLCPGKTSKINHRGENRLKVEFPFNTAIANKIRQIKGAAWSRTQNAWHIPYTEEAFEQLKKEFPDIIITDLESYGKNIDLLKNYFNDRITHIQTIVAIPQNYPVYLTTEIITDLPLLGKTGEQEIIIFKQWMEHKRYSEQ